MHDTDASAPHQINIYRRFVTISHILAIITLNQESMDLITDWLKNYEMKWNVHCLK